MKSSRTSSRVIAALRTFATGPPAQTALAIRPASTFGIPGVAEHALPLGLVVVALALLSRGLHLDGLADLADGLGSRRPAAGAHEVMARSDIGPFGVAAVVLALLLQVAAQPPYCCS